jgi:hypothetical protein
MPWRGGDLYEAGDGIASTHNADNALAGTFGRLG